MSFCSSASVDFALEQLQRQLPNAAVTHAIDLVICSLLD
jgi:hypothetical protein